LNEHITILFHIPSKKSTTNSPSAIYLNDLLHLAKFGKGKKKTDTTVLLLMVGDERKI
jgi:hypothetical protein